MQPLPTRIMCASLLASLYVTLIHSFFLLYFLPSLFFFFNDTATTEIYTLSLHDALPILLCCHSLPSVWFGWPRRTRRSEEHTSELQSRGHLVCRLLLEKKNVGVGHVLNEVSVVLLDAYLGGAELVLDVCEVAVHHADLEL